MSETPVYDVITSLEDMLTSVTHSALGLTRLPADLAALLGATGTAAGPTIGGPYTGPPTTGAALTQLLTPPQSISAPTISNALSAAPFPELGAFAALETKAALTTQSQRFASPAAPVDAAEPGSAIPALITGAIAALVVSVSLWALLTAALPGLSGLVAITATGVRIGYRQANAGIALRTTELARFAGTGPIGVVRSDSLIAVHPRALSAARPERQVLGQVA